ncbi:MAG: family 78 glycoside hydrolase catalytic domain [Fimbriimonas sp.]
MLHALRVLLVLATATLSLAAVGRAVPKSGMTATNLRCEYRLEPIGIDAAQPRLSCNFEATKGARDRHVTAVRILVATSLDLLNDNKGDLWDSGITPYTGSVTFPYGGLPLNSGQICYWKVQPHEKAGPGTWSKPARFEMGLLHPNDWEGQWLNDGKPTPKADIEFYANDPAPLFRKEFAVPRQVKRARLAIAGLGYVEASINGKRVGDQVLDPGWTKFDKRVGYSVYDVTRHLARGQNCIGVILGNGWYSPLPMKLFGSFNMREHLAIGRPRVLAQIKIEYTDGTVETIATNTSWKIGESSILRNNVYLGEVVDARREQPGWDKPGFDDSRWREPSIAAEPVGRLVNPPQPPIRITGRWAATKVTEPKPGVRIYDMGVNFAGWVTLNLDVPAGTEIRLRYGELLYGDGTLNPMTSVAGQLKWLREGTNESAGGPGVPPIAWQADTYIARGGGETYSPKFTFRGFRYVEITGLPSALPLADVVALRLNSDIEEVGAFECSNPLLNNIQTVCKRTFLSNIFSVQSDCPHREKLGYGGDIVATSEAFMANFDMSGFYSKAVHDWTDSALADGMFTDTAPFIGIQYCGLIWAMAQPLLSDQLYQYYGDSRTGSDGYESAKRWLLLVESQNPSGIISNGLSDHESLTENPAPELVTPMYFQSAEILARLASRLKRKHDHEYFSALAAKIRAAYGAKFVDEVTGKVGPGTQTSQAMALYTGIVPERSRPKVLAYLVKTIHDRNDHLTTGILGTKFMLEVLSREGHIDLAYKIATQPDFPGWGWMLENGATTLWEHWAFSDNTFSHNHPMFGSVSQWMLQSLGGIRPSASAAGSDFVEILPKVPAGLDWVKSSYMSVRGKIVSNWEREGETLRFEIEVPVGVAAQVQLPAMAVDDVREGGKVLSNSLGVSSVRKGEGLVDFLVGSGRYLFEVKRSRVGG